MHSAEKTDHLDMEKVNPELNDQQQWLCDRDGLVNDAGWGNQS
jgi:hypothetical protein